MLKPLFACAFAAVFSASFALTCTDPTVESTSFTTQDATIVSQIAFISEFTLKCSNKASESTPLFAEVDGKLAPVARIGTDRFQVRKNSSPKLTLTKDMCCRRQQFYILCINFGLFTRSAGRRRQRKHVAVNMSPVCSTKKVSLPCARHNDPVPIFNRFPLWPK